LKIYLVTTNQGKLREFRSVLEPIGIDVQHSDVDCDEIQADTLREVVVSCVEQLKAKGLRDFVLDDSGLFVHALKDFPGVYSSYALKTIGLDGLLHLLNGKADRSAHFECCVGASIAGEEFIVSGRCDGSIALHPSGTGGFGFDPLFVPSGYSQTFAEISIGEKNRISHRGKAVQAFSDELRRRLNEAQR
jgi:XTP/dITP diphosphohydrolase